MKSHNQIQSFLVLLSAILFLSACDQEEPTATTTVIPPTMEAAPVITVTESPQPVHIQSDSQFTIGNKRYLYDISEHSIEELQALLQRAEEITQTGTENLEDLEIVMILHGPDINWFTLDNYDDNKELVDLAKKLDTFDIIDLKVCETSLKSLNIDQSQIPTFIEPVPFAPNEINRLSDDGYTHL